jgi:glycerol-3-phosphate acyltransferase PlsX
LQDTLPIALDAMGGDDAPDMVIAGADIAAERYPDARFLLFGDQARLEPLVARYGRLCDRCEIRHSDKVVSADDRPGQALRHGQDSSMGLALQSVRDGESLVAVSAGNTGALMALARFMLHSMPGIDRPALATFLPTLRGESVMLDLGANVECDEKNLVQFAVMGAAYARAVLGLSRPRVALLNVGVEELKGNNEVKGAAEQLKDAPLPLEFSGFIEGDGIGAGTVDVVVTDGFTGNIALKTAEGTARLVGALLGEALRDSLLTRIAYLLARKGLKALKEHLDPNNHNGGVMLGLNGLVVKSHGGANAAGYASAIGVAVDMARADLCAHIAEDLKNFATAAENTQEAAAS